MISENTVFILGAGASVDSGFPTGEILVDRIWANVDEHDSGSQNLLNKALVHHKIKSLSENNGTQNFTHKDAQDLLKKFASDLKNSRTSSIDDFIHNTRDILDYTLIGKLAIIQEISRREKESNLFRQIEKKDFSLGEQLYRGLARNWYKSLWKTIYEECTDIYELKESLSKITFITFNYDRSLEHQLFVSIKAMFQLNEDSIKTLLNQSLKIYHIYGQIGFLPWQNKKIDTFLSHNKNNTNESDIKNPYEPLKDNFDQWLKLTSVIKTYMDIDKSSPVQQANNEHFNHHNFNIQWVKKAILDAKKVFVFGFSFHSQNLILFNVPSSDDQTSKFDVKISGTSLGLGHYIKKQKLSQFGSSLNCDISESDFLDSTIDEFYYGGHIYK